MTDQHKIVRGLIYREINERPCCLLTEHVVPQVPVISKIWPPNIIDPATELKHRFGTSKWGYFFRLERSGHTYTCNGGFIDLGHVRDVAEMTYFYLQQFRKKNRTGHELETATYQEDGSSIRLLKDLPVGDFDVLINIARSLAYDESIFHEIETYYNQRNSAFSPEDLTSNFLGTHVAEQAIRKMVSDGSYLDATLTLELEKLIRNQLGARPVEETRQAFERVDGTWMESHPVVPNGLNSGYIRRRNFNVRPIEPWLIPNFAACPPGSSFPDSIPRQLSTEWRSFYEVEYRKRIGWSTDPTSEIATFIGPRLDEYIEVIKADALNEYGPNFDKPDLP